MKRKIALLLTVIMLVTFIIPMQSFAQSDEELTRAITVAKTKFDIPQDYKFNYNVYTDNGKRVWYLSWSAKDEISGSINVNVDEDGIVRGYNKYKPDMYSKQGKLPKYSKKDAKSAAEKFIEKVNPNLMSQLKYQDNVQNSLLDYSYYFSYVRLVNGIPYYNNNVSVSVNRDTGEVISYYYYWDDSLQFPAPENIITEDEAKSAYKEKLGLELLYNYRLEDDDLKIYAVYTPRYGNYQYAVDAFTGERIQLEPMYGIYKEESAMDAANNLKRAAGASSTGVVLTPEEIKAINEVSKLISSEEAERIARDASFLKLTKDYKLNTPSLSRSWPNNNEFIWYLNFTKEPENEKDIYMYVSCTINAVTGEIMNFYRSLPYDETGKPPYDQEKSRTEAEKFLKRLIPDKFSDLEYDEDSNTIYYYYQSEEPPRQFSFSYIRKVNGIPFPGNGVSITFDAVKGEVVSYNLNWFNQEFPSIENVVSMDSVYDTMFRDVGLELQYKTRYIPRDSIKMPTPSSDELEVKLVYALAPDKPLTFDADTGVMLGYDGKPYEEIKPVEYTDIAGHFAEKQISVLAEFGVALDGTEFKPDENIKQKEFLTLLSKTMNTYYGPIIRADSNTTEIDSMYAFMIREGVIKQEEKAPEAAVTREDAVKYIIRALKYDKVADLKDIFINTFKDASEVNPDLIGYVTIAAALKIINGNNERFMPKNKLTRAEAAVIIYNYLQN